MKWKSIAGHVQMVVWRKKIGNIYVGYLNIESWSGQCICMGTRTDFFGESVSRKNTLWYLPAGLLAKES